MKDINIHVPKNALLAIKMLSFAGFEAGVVGGCTRDAIIGTIPHDWDICTSALPDEIISVFRDFKLLTVGLKHGTITVIIDDEEIEITTYRIDGEYTDGRRPDDVSFTRNLVEDLSRRDFTQNAIFYNEFDGIVDPFNGINDINNKIIRCVGDPNKRLQEDSLRILRGIRFAATLGFEIEETTKQAMFKNKELLKNVSMERLSVEFIKMLQGKNGTKVLDEFREIFAFIIPEFQSMFNFNQHNSYHIYDVWNHTLVAVKNSNSLLIRLTMLLHDIGKPRSFTIGEDGIGHFYGHADISYEIANNIFKRMKITSCKELSSTKLNDILELIKYHDIRIEPRKKSIRKMLSKLGGNQVQFERLLAVKKADALAQAPNKLANSLEILEKLTSVFKDVIKEIPCFTTKDLDINGNDLIKIGIQPGKKIGEILNLLLESVINEEINNEKKSLLNKAKDFI